jgi:hypothetical protein
MNISQPIDAVSRTSDRFGHEIGIGLRWHHKQGVQLEAAARWQAQRLVSGGIENRLKPAQPLCGGADRRVQPTFIGASSTTFDRPCRILLCECPIWIVQLERPVNTVQNVRSASETACRAPILT